MKINLYLIILSHIYRIKLKKKFVLISFENIDLNNNDNVKLFVF